MIDKSKYKPLILFTVIVLTVILVSCGTSNSNLTTISFTEVITQTSLPMVTNTLTPIPTMEPTLAFWATADSIQYKMTNTQSSATNQAFSILNDQYQDVCDFLSISTSPNGKWIFGDCYFGPHKILETNRNQIWTIPYAGIGEIDILNWSVNEDYVYFAQNLCCADIDATTNGDTLFRFNLKTGEYFEIITGRFNYYSFSPDGEKLVYIKNNIAAANQSIFLHLYDLNLGVDEIIKLYNLEQGRVVWEKNSQKIAVIAKTGNFFEDNEKYSLIVIDLTNKNQQVIILNSEYIIDILDWSSDDILKIEEANPVLYNNYYINIRNSMYYDLKTGWYIIPSSDK